jgi:predicted NAD/FAD-dependent oxidoreductase
MKKKIAVIGAGISGVYVAKELSKIADMKVFEKSRGFGGRMSTRTRDDYQFDHGGQYFTARGKQFHNFLQPYINNGNICKWNPNIVRIEKEHNPKITNLSPDIPFYVPVPKMSGFCRHLASDLNVCLETKIDKIIKKGNKWNLYQGDKDLGSFDWVICAIPSHQVAEIMPKCFSYMNKIRNIKMQGCYSLMLGFMSPLDIKWDAASVNGYDISWVAVNSTKPERPKQYSVIAHSTNEWAERNIDIDPEKVKSHLMSELSEIIGQNLTSADHIDLHRWRYANARKQKGKKAYIDFDSNLAACGDWCIEGKVEAAFNSACHIVELIKNKLD